MTSVIVRYIHLLLLPQLPISTRTPFLFDFGFNILINKDIIISIANSKFNLDLIFFLHYQRDAPFPFPSFKEKFRKRIHFFFVISSTFCEINTNQEIYPSRFVYGYKEFGVVPFFLFLWFFFLCPLVLDHIVLFIVMKYVTCG